MLLIACAVSGKSQAQPSVDAAAFAHQDQVAALEALLAGGRAPSLTPEQLIDMSRLLSDPCDQLRWLRRRIESTTDADGRQALLAGALKRRDALQGAGVLDCRAVADALDAFGAVARSIPELTDPAALAKRTTSPNWKNTTKSPEDKFVLLARGAPFSLLAPNATERSFRRTRWDHPRQTMEKLVALTEFSGVVGFTLSTPDTSMDAAPARITEAFLRLAQGGAVGDTDWAAEAQRLGKAGLWSWSALAWLLDACADSSRERSSFDAALREWNKLRDYRQRLGSAARQHPWAEVDQWLARLERGADWTIAGTPLRASVRAQRAAARAGFEQTAMQSSNPDQALRAIQQAKLAEIGADPGAALSLATVLNRLRAEKGIYLFVEVLQSQQGAGCVAVAIYDPAYGDVMAGQGGPNPYEQKLIRDAANPADAVRAALAGGPPPGRGDARILIALDAPPDDRWFAFERQSLLPLTSSDSPTDPAWVVYLPSVAALGGASPWDRDNALRKWYTPGADLLLGGVFRPGADTPLAQNTILQIGFGAAASASNLSDLMRRKRGASSALRVLAVAVAR
ncbi:MAG: hypothetical protein D6744_08580 [Planctomycetota bacterium]|nr:MAG: hypothetical protein D6744_08580 [Planctomycetota bacterium]